MRQFGCVSGHGSLQAGVWEIPDPQVYQVAIRLALKQKSENGRECGSNWILFRLPRWDTFCVSIVSLSRFFSRSRS